MKSNNPLAIIGGYDSIAKSFFKKIQSINKSSIFINVNNNNVIYERVYNYKIFELKKILTVLKKNKIKYLLFIGKINRPDLTSFKSDGVIDNYIPILYKSFRHGDGKILKSVIDIFLKEGFKILSPNKISSSFFLNNSELSKYTLIDDKKDVKKSIKLLNDLSKYDNAQSIVCIKGYILAIEAAEGTDNLLIRSAKIRKELGVIERKAGIITKIPKKNQSKLIDLPVIGEKTLRLIKKANLNGIAINPKLTIIHNKIRFLRLAKKYDLKIYNALS